MEQQTKESLETRLNQVRAGEDDILTANAEVWKQIALKSISRFEGFSKSLENGEQLMKLMQEEKSIVKKLIEFEEKQ